MGAVTIVLTLIVDGKVILDNLKHLFTFHHRPVAFPL